VPTTLELSLTGLSAGTHTLTVKVHYKKTTNMGKRKNTVTVTTAVKTRFHVC
jgi:hypothetical protein